MNTAADLNLIEVFYDKNDSRTVKCFCGKVCRNTIVPHMKKQHLKTWNSWCSDFVRLRNKGWAPRRIMWKYKAIFTWTVIEHEIKRLVEEGKASLKIPRKEKIVSWLPQDSQLENTTVWSFLKRGEWATHQSDYRGNWPPQLPRNLILRYTRGGDIVFDPFVGGGTTLIEAYLLGRKSVGIDINPMAVKMSKQRIREMETASDKDDVNLSDDYRPIVRLGDARKSVEILSRLGFAENSIDLVCGHPPYLDAIKYTENSEADFSHIDDADVFCDEMQKVAKQTSALLKEGGHCAILMGDIRKDKKLVPLGFEVMKRFQEEDLALKEIIIKLQHKDSSTEFYFNKGLGNYLLAHEYVFVFEKPNSKGVLKH